MRWHLSPKTREPEKCTAEEGNCPYGGDHYNSFDEAYEANQERLESKYGGAFTLPAPTQRDIYNTLVRENAEKIDEIIAEINHGDIEPEEGYTARMRPSWLDEGGGERRERLEKIQEAGRLAYETVRARIELEDFSTVDERAKEYNEVEKTLQSKTDELKKLPIQKVRRGVYLDKEEDRQTYTRLAREINSTNAEQIKLATGFSKEFTKTYGKVTKEALEDLGVVFNTDHDIEYLIETAHHIGSKETEDAVRRSLPFVPRNWVGELNFSIISKNLRGKSGSVQYNMNPLYGGIVSLITDRSTATTLHEFGHVAEKKNPILGRVQRDFLASIREPGNIKKEGNYNYVSEELISKYAARYYAPKYSKEFKLATDYGYTTFGSSYEVLTTGLQGLFSPHSPSESFPHSENKEKHEEFTLGMILLSKKYLRG